MITTAVNLENYLTGRDANGNTLAHILIENCDNEDFTLEIQPFKIIENNLPDEQKLLFECFEKINGSPKEVHDALFKAYLDTIDEKINNNKKLDAIVAIDTMTVEDIFTIKNNNNETIHDVAKRKSAQNPESQRCRFCNNLLEVIKMRELASKDKEQ
jgi:hypothetical protein